MIRLADYVWQFLADQGVRHVFMVTGGGAMHLNDAMAAQSRIAFICNHHEQGCTIGAEGYARVTGRPGVASVTSGPGGVNALNGVYGCWMDSIPALVISGQIKRETCKGCYDSPVRDLRQLGDQEADIIGMAKVVTKYARLVDDPNTIRYHLERAWHLATAGRPGPCWLDIPLDVQSAQIDPASLAGYDPKEDAPPWDLAGLPARCAKVRELLLGARRPVLLAGSGVRLAGAIDLLEQTAARLGVPVVLSRTARDLVPYDSPYYAGRAGIDADRTGNFVVQNSDVLLALGCRLNTRQIGYNWASFARAAVKIQVDADPLELNKPTLRPDLPVCCDVRLFLEELNRQLDATPNANESPNNQVRADWLGWCKQRLERYPAVRDDQRRPDGLLNPYHFLETLFEHLADDDTVVCGNGGAFIMAFHVARPRRGQRWFFNSGCASMGYDLPAAIGAAVARGGKRVICLAGDGSIQMNIQELQTMAHHRLPIKLFILNNEGYLSIRTTQTSFFGRLIGESPASGVTFPDMVRIGQAYGIPSVRVDHQNFRQAVPEAMARPGPTLCDVVVDPKQTFEPRMSSRQLPDGRLYSPPIEDMFPFLSREEVEANMLIPMIGS